MCVDQNRDYQKSIERDGGFCLLHVDVRSNPRYPAVR